MKLLIGSLWIATVICAYWYGTSQLNSQQTAGPGYVNITTDAAKADKQNVTGSQVLPVDEETAEGAVTNAESAYKPVTVDDALKQNYTSCIDF